jgi:hypothetical protein
MRARISLHLQDSTNIGPDVAIGADGGSSRRGPWATLDIASAQGSPEAVLFIYSPEQARRLRAAAADIEAALLNPKK